MGHRHDDNVDPPDLRGEQRKKHQSPDHSKKDARVSAHVQIVLLKFGGNVAAQVDTKLLGSPPHGSTLALPMPGSCPERRRWSALARRSGRLCESVATLRSS
jgi:hypothetical protein